MLVISCSWEARKEHPVNCTCITLAAAVCSVLLCTSDNSCADTGNMKDQNAKWVPVDARFQHLLRDIVRVWPGPGETGLQLQQVGVTVPLDSVREPCVRVSAKKKRGNEYGHFWKDVSKVLPGV